MTDLFAYSSITGRELLRIGSSAQWVSAGKPHARLIPLCHAVHTDSTYGFCKYHTWIWCACNCL